MERSLTTGNQFMTDHSIQGKTVLIAGGAKNLGGLLARDLAIHGAKAVATRRVGRAAVPSAGGRQPAAAALASATRQSGRASRASHRRKGVMTEGV